MKWAEMIFCRNLVRKEASLQVLSRFDILDWADCKLLYIQSEKKDNNI